jgi:hypothetical protein
VWQQDKTCGQIAENGTSPKAHKLMVDVCVYAHDPEHGVMFKCMASGWIVSYRCWRLKVTETAL